MNSRAAIRVVDNVIGGGEALLVTELSIEALWQVMVSGETSVAVIH